MPRVVVGTYDAISGEQLRERAARTLLTVELAGPYPRAGTLTVFVTDDGRLTMRFDIEITNGAARVTFMRGQQPIAKQLRFLSAAATMSSQCRLEIMKEHSAKAPISATPPFPAPLMFERDKYKADAGKAVCNIWRMNYTV